MKACLERPSILSRWQTAVRRPLTLGGVSLALLFSGSAFSQATAPAAPATATAKTLRVAFQVAETGFDPIQVNDKYSRTVLGHIVEAPYRFDYLALPVKIKPLTAAGMPEVSSDYRTWTIKIQPGIYFADDPAFKGKRRELTAQDYVYTLKRAADPATKSPHSQPVLDEGMIGLDALREEAKKTGRFDYDREIEGLRAIDRHTLRVTLKDPRPRFINLLTNSEIYGAVAREVVEHYGSEIMAHPVGTGPFRLASWRRGSRITLERNPGFRTMLWDAEPAPDDEEGRQLLARFKGRPLPLVDRVEISIINESQPRYLSFVNGEMDELEVPVEYLSLAVPRGQLAPNLAKQGVKLQRQLQSDITITYFNMEDPVVGGFTPDKVALRRAISLGIDIDREITVLRKGHAVKAEGMVLPHTPFFDPQYKSANSEFDPAKANALLDLYGYLDKDGDGWRDLPDSQPLVLRLATQPDPTSRAMDELWQRDMRRLKLKITFVPAKWPENFKSARAGKLQMWTFSTSADIPDNQDLMRRLYSVAANAAGNHARFRMKQYDQIYLQALTLPDGPERMALYDQMRRLSVAYMPYRWRVHRYLNYLQQPWMLGYRRLPFVSSWYQYVDIDVDKQPEAR